VNKQLLHVSVVSLVLLAVLIVSTTYWQTWAVGDLANRQHNAVALVARLAVDRGKIFGAGGTTLLAANRAHRKHGLTTFTRRYPGNDLAPQVIGYSTAAGTTTGIEEEFDDYLTGANTNLSSTFTAELNRLGGQTVHGDNVILTLRPAIQRLALQQLAGRCGAVVVLDAKTGAVYAMASSPTYNANLIEQPKGFAKLGHIKGACGDASALQNNATQGLYPPGSSFKLITASAALDTGAYTPNSRFYDPGYCIEYGKKVYNSSAPDSPSAHETFGNVDFSQALEHSINAVFCKIGMHLGAKTILDYAKRYGFYSSPPLDLPSSVLYPSGLYKNGKPWFPKDPATEVDPGRLAFGQERLLVTPLQMAVVAATVPALVARVPALADRVARLAGGGSRGGVDRAARAGIAVHGNAVLERQPVDARAAERAEMVVERVVLHHQHDDVLDLRQRVGAFGLRRIGPLARAPYAAGRGRRGGCERRGR